MADTLETLAHLALWTGKDPAVVAADPFAQFVLEKATELVVDKAGIPSTWTVDPTVVPARAKTICLLVAARTYTNRRSIISQAVGPISETMMAQMAAAMQLTEAETEELEQMRQEGAGDFGGLWVLSTTRGTDYPIQDTVNLPDSSGSDWLIPYAVEGETGAFDTLMDDPTGGGVDPGAFALLQAQVSTLMANVNTLDGEKADQDAVDAALANKADASDLGALETTLSTKADASALAALVTQLADKADAGDVNAALALKAAQSAVDALTTIVDGKADQSAVDDALELKANLDDLGPQIQVGDTPPATGSGKLWADTDS